MASQSPPPSSKEIAALDDPLIALTQRCNGDLRKVLTSFFSFLHRRTDFYLVPHDDDLHEGRATMGFRQGDAEKILLASFRQFPLRRIPKQPVPEETTAKSQTASAPRNPAPEVPNSIDEPTLSSTENVASEEKTQTTTDDEVRRTEEGLQIPVGNGGTTTTYKWTQTLEECSVIVGIPGGLRAKDLKVDIKPTSISVRSKEPTAGDTEPLIFLEGSLVAPVIPDESTWTLERGVLVLALYKKTKTFWATIIEGDDKIDTSLVDSRRHIRDYDESTQAMIRKIMFDQNQTNLGLPTSEQLEGAKPLTPENLPPGVEYIYSNTLDSSRV
ncbi:hypothetical protein ACA910_012708 [Epithemia clementina (nom. ined.)]